MLYQYQNYFFSSCGCNMEVTSGTTKALIKALERRSQVLQLGSK